MQTQFRKLLIATAIGTSLAASGYGVADETGAIAVEQRAGARAEQSLQGSLSGPRTGAQSPDTAAASAVNAADTATQAADALQQGAPGAADLNASAVGDATLRAVSELSGEGGTVQEQIKASATGTTAAAISGLRGAQVAVVDGANSGRAEIAHYSAVAGQVLQSGQAATANLSAQTGAAIQGEVSRADTVAGGVIGLSQAALGQTEISEPALPVDGALPATPSTSLPTPEATVNGWAQADVSGSAGLAADTQRLNLNTQQRMQTDVGFSSAGSGRANTTLGSSIGGSVGGSVGGITSGGSVLGTGSLLR